jgi:hypothetical protein
MKPSHGEDTDDPRNCWCSPSNPHRTEPPVPADSGAARVSRRIASLQRSVDALASEHGLRDVRMALTNEIAGLRFALEAITGVKP